MIVFLEIASRELPFLLGRWKDKGEMTGRKNVNPQSNERLKTWTEDYEGILRSMPCILRDSCCLGEGWGLVCWWLPSRTLRANQLSR